MNKDYYYYYYYYENSLLTKENICLINTLYIIATLPHCIVFIMLF